MSPGAPLCSSHTVPAALLPKLLPVGNDESQDFSSIEKAGEGGKWE